MRLESGEGVKLLCRCAVLGFGPGWQRGLGFGARGETVWLVQLENGDGGGDDDPLHFYVAIIIPQIPLSKIDGVVNQFSASRAREI